MSRILKALFKTILTLLGIILFMFLGNMLPYVLITLLIIILVIVIFFNFYENEED